MQNATYHQLRNPMSLPPLPPQIPHLPPNPDHLSNIPTLPPLATPVLTTTYLQTNTIPPLNRHHLALNSKTARIESQMRGANVSFSGGRLLSV